MRRLVYTTVTLGVIFVGGILFGQNVSFDVPGISVGGGDGNAAPAVEAVTESVQEKTEEVRAEVQTEVQEAAGNFKIMLREDRIYYNEREISMKELDALIAQAKEQGGTIEVEYDPESVTGQFVDQVRGTLNAAEVRNFGISR